MLKPHSPYHFSTMQFNTGWAEELLVEDSRFDTFLREIVVPEDVHRIYEMFGYCMVASAAMHKAFLLVGEGSNGKSPLLMVLTELLRRENICAVALQALSESRWASAKLFGKAANIYPDAPLTTLVKNDVFNVADYFGTTLVKAGTTIYSVRLTGLVKVGSEVMRYSGIRLPGTTDAHGQKDAVAADGPVLLNLERAQRGTAIANNHDVQPVYFIDNVVSMTEDYFVHPINRLDLRLDPSQVYNVIQIDYNGGESSYTHDVSEPGEIKRTFSLSVSFDVHQSALVKWLA